MFHDILTFQCHEVACRIVKPHTLKVAQKSLGSGIITQRQCDAFLQCRTSILISSYTYFLFEFCCLGATAYLHFDSSIWASILTLSTEHLLKFKSTILFQSLRNWLRCNSMLSVIVVSVFLMYLAENDEHCTRNDPYIFLEWSMLHSTQHFSSVEQLVRLVWRTGLFTVPTTMMHQMMYQIWK